MDGLNRLNELLTVGDAARRLGLSTQRIRQLIADGQLPCTETRLGRLIMSADVDALGARRAADQ